MDLTRQPPRRPTNLGIAGIVGAARLTDKARSHNAETTRRVSLRRKFWLGSTSFGVSGNYC